MFVLLSGKCKNDLPYQTETINSIGSPTTICTYMNFHWEYNLFVAASGRCCFELVEINCR